jgi:Cu/Ag efflux pump CusA
VILQASLEVRTSVVYATFVVALVFLPVLTLTGVHGHFFAPLALSYILAILASLGVALTLTPALAGLILTRSSSLGHEPALQRWLKDLYSGLLHRLITSPGVLGFAVIVACIGAAFVVPRLGGEFLPAFRERHFVLQASAAPGTSLPEMRRLGEALSRELMHIEGIATVEQQIGRAELGEDPWGPHRSEFHVELKPVGSREEAAIEDRIRSLLESFPGIQSEVLTFLGDRIGETIAGETAPVVISLFGTDLDLLDRKARDIIKVLHDIPGAADVQIKSPPGSPRIAIRLRPERLREHGLRPLEVMEAVQTAYQGTTVAQTYEDNRVTDVVVTLEEEVRRDPERVASLQLRTPAGVLLPLREVADVYATSGRHSILHDGARRRQTITCNPAGRDVASFVAEARRAIAAGVALPPGTYLAFGGAAEAAAAARRQLGLHSTVASVGILLLLSLVFQNARNLMLVLANLPFAFVGGILAIAVHRWGTGSGEGAGVSIGSLVGFVTLFGITTRNSIMLVSHFEHLVATEGQPWSPATAIRGAAERLIPILMTALVTSLGLLPLALGSGEAGREIEGPMAIVILGGLITSTLLNLLALPALALRFGRFKPAPRPEGAA